MIIASSGPKPEFFNQQLLLVLSKAPKFVESRSNLGKAVSLADRDHHISLFILP